MKKLTILVAPLQAVGHINACAGALTSVLERGHRVIFILMKAYEGKLKQEYGYEEYIVLEPIEEKKKEDVSSLGAFVANYLVDAKIIGPYSPKEKEENCRRLLELPNTMARLANVDRNIKSAIAEFKPDLIYADDFRYPAILHSGIPWVFNISYQPLHQNYDDNLPPGGSGLPTDGDRSEWAEWSELRWWRNYKCKSYNDCIEQMGYPRFDDDKYPQTQLFSVYAVPEEFNYLQLRANPTWFNIEVFNKPDKFKQVAIQWETIISSDFLNDNLDGKYTGKLIYVSMGSMGSIDLGVMKRLVAALAKTNHKYIVSTGPRHAEYKLASNMWGREFLPQTSIVPYVDLVITHGGNNTVTEVFAEGKPMIVLPMFCDQYDNAQRLQETGFGARVDPYDFEEGKLLDAIERFLNDEALRLKLKCASERILPSNHHEQLALLIETKLYNCI